MPILSLIRPRALALIALIPCLCLTAASSWADPVPVDQVGAGEKPLNGPAASLASFLDRLPELTDQGLPGFAPEGALRFFLRPRFGDLIHENYFRLPVGARLKINDHLELNGELGSYFTHSSQNSAGYGLYQFDVGIKREAYLTRDAGLSYGLDYSTPLSRPPISITDGLRHTLPYFTATHSLLPHLELVGFATFGGDFISHTALPVNFRKNELRADSMIVTLGLAREWRRMHVVLQVFDGNTALLSGMSQNVFGFRPSIGVPFLRRPDGTPRFTATFEARTVWGPDGFETGITTRVRFDLRYKSSSK
jgi:hypothetical protein